MSAARPRSVRAGRVAAVAAGAGGKPLCAGRRLAGIERHAPVADLVARWPPPRSGPIARSPTAGRCAGIAEGGAAIAGASSIAAARASPGATTRLASPIASASSAPTARPVRIRSIARRVPDEPRQPDRAEVDQRHAEAPAEHTEYRRRRGDAQVAPQRQLQPAGDGVALDGRDHRLRQPQPRRAQRRVAIRRRPRSTSPAATAFRSAPAQKWPPAPVSTAT